jgi:microcin C transport system substrate-binding protein
MQNSLRFFIFSVFFVFSTAAFASNTTKSHAISIYGKPKYEKNFAHVKYANPNAQKGGTILLHSLGGFDSLNSFTLKGNPAPDLGLMFDNITVQLADDPGTEYCLICESLEYPADRSWIQFKLNPKAKFHDGSSITSADVAFSFATLTKNLPIYKAYFADVNPPEVIDAQTVKFTFKKSNNELPVIIGQLPVLSKAYWEKKDITKTTLEIPVGNGPYKVKSFETGRSITYERVKDYWAADLPPQKGKYNFDLIRYDIYGDNSVSLEAFKGGSYDFREEYSSKSWNQDYEFEGKRKGQVIMELVSDESPQGMQGFAFNLRREIFKDIKVRKALNLLFDFEWMNQNLFFNAYERTNSYFENSPMAAKGTPKGAELKILSKFKDQLPAELFTKEFFLPKNKIDAGKKENLKAALKLFEEAGWKIQGGKLKNSAGKPFVFEFLMGSDGLEKVVLAFKESLQRAGIEMSIRNVDRAQYLNRLRDFDYDMISWIQGQSDFPGNEQREYWGSAAAKQKGSRNYIGIENPAIDAIIEPMVASKSYEILKNHINALDRILLWNYYVIPNWYFGKQRISYWNKFSRPKVNPSRGGVTVHTWWIDPVKEKALKAARGK